MSEAQTSPIKWWHLCLAVVGLIVLLTYLGRRSFNTTQTYSEKISAGTTPVIEGEPQPVPASGASGSH